MPYFYESGLVFDKGSGIYTGTCLVNSKVYVGSAKSLKGRIANHLSQLQYNKHPNIHLQRAWNKYGEKSFRFALVEHCKVEDLTTREQYWIDTLDSNNQKKGYNICPIANSRLGTKHSEETKSKISQVKKGTKMSEEACQRMSEARRGKKQSAEHTQNCIDNHWSRGPNAKEIANKIAKGHVGKGHTPERRRNIAIAKKVNRFNRKVARKLRELDPEYNRTI